MNENYNIYIHIGFHRTGSTFLQTEFFPVIPNSNCIDQFEIIDELVALTTTDEFIWKNTNIKDVTIKSIEDKLDVTKINIISAEALSGYPFIKSVNRSLILNRIKNIFPEAKIILGIRSQDKLIQSFYSLYIREGGTLKLNELLEKQKKGYFGYSIYDSLIETIDLEALNYSLVLRQLYGLFDKKDVYVFLLEELKNSSKAITNLSDFFNVKITIESKKKVNAKFPDNALIWIRLINILTRGFKSKSKIRHLQKGYINKLISKLVYKSVHNINISYEININEYFKEDNKKLIELLPQYKEYIQNFNKQ